MGFCIINIIQVLYMDNIQESANKIKNMYSSLSYYEQYGGQIFLFIILTILVFLVYAYCTIMLNVQHIKDDWANKRCDPNVLPFAGFINAPPGKSATNFTQENFAYCLQNIQKTITGDALQPLTYVTDLLQNLYSNFSEDIQNVRELMNNVRDGMENVTKDVMERAINFVVPLQKIVFGFKDMLGRMQGVLTTSLFTSLGSYYALKSLLGSIVEFIVIILTTLSVLIASLWILPATWPAAAANSTIFVAIAIPLTITAVFLKQVMGIQSSTIPELKCFDENVDIELIDGTFNKIKLIEVGDRLHDGSFVTGKMIVDASNLDMYYIRGIIVSGCHIVKHGENWIPVSDHPLSKKLTKYKKPCVYCLNTTNKTINIGEIVFSDWDEIYDSTLEKKKQFISKTFGINNADVKNSDIHKYLDGGFDKNTCVVLKNGTKKIIADVELNDVLENGEKVYALVEIAGLGKTNYNLGNNSCFLGGGKLDFFDKNLGQTSTLLLSSDYYSPKNNSSERLYHLVTDKGTFKVGDLMFNDYNSCVDLTDGVLFL